jgi:CheY-like chemotaxis protein
VNPPLILIIEDNDQNLYLMRFLLEQHGIVVKAAMDGREGIEMAKRIAPDLILLDIQLPLLDGHAVARELRKEPGLRTTPIIAVTSYAMPGDREKCLEAGATAYIEKPIDPEVFVDQVREHLPQRDDPKASLPCEEGGHAAP